MCSTLAQAEKLCDAGWVRYSIYYELTACIRPSRSYVVYLFEGGVLQITFFLAEMGSFQRSSQSPELHF